MDLDHLTNRPEFDLVMLSNFVHQVVNPLNGVVGTLDNLIDGTIGDDRRIQRTSAAKAQLEGCINLLRNLAFLVRNPEPSDVVKKGIVVLPQVIIEAAMYFQEEAGNRGISIDLEDRGTQNRCQGHPELVRQVLMNIFDNCAKYSMRDTEVVVRQWIQRRTDTAMITVSSTPSHPISNADMQRIFDLGFRGQNAKDAIASGTGLGMYICRQIVEEMHGGKINVSKERANLKFEIRLPEGVSDGAHDRP